MTPTKSENTTDTSENNGMLSTIAIATIVTPHALPYGKLFPDISKIEVFEGQHFKRWQERIFSILDMHGVAGALSDEKLN